MKSVKIDILNFDMDEESAVYDILCIQQVQYADEVVGCSIVNLELLEDTLIHKSTIKFEWRSDTYKMSDDDFYFIAETGVLFFRPLYQWGVIDISNNNLKRHEYAHDIPSIYKKNNFILIHDELYAESVRFNGDKIDNVPIEPPYEMIKYDDRIEYTSLVYGHQALKTR